MELTLAVRKFLEYCDLERKYSFKTVETYLTALTQFRAYIFEIYQTEIDPNEITVIDIRGFLGDLHDKEYSRESLRLKIAAVKSFFKFCVRHSIIEKNISSLISTPKKEKLLPSYLTIDETERSIESFDINTRDGAMYSALSELL